MSTYLCQNVVESWVCNAESFHLFCQLNASLFPVFIHPVVTATLKVPLFPQSPVQGAIPTNLPNTAVALRPPYSPGLPAPSPQLPPAYFTSSVSQVSSLEPYPPLAQRDQGSTHAQDALGGAYSPGDTDPAGGLDSLSEYTLPGESVYYAKLINVSCAWK